MGSPPSSVSLEKFSLTFDRLSLLLENFKSMFDIRAKMEIANRLFGFSKAVIFWIFGTPQSIKINKLCNFSTFYCCKVVSFWMCDQLECHSLSIERRRSR